MEGIPAACRDVTMTSSYGDAAVRHVIDYVMSPATLVTHLAMFCLLCGFLVDGGLRRRQLTLVLLGEELLVYGLWLAVGHGLRAPLAIWICVLVYESIVKPRITYQDRAILLTGKQLSFLFSNIPYCYYLSSYYIYYAVIFIITGLARSSVRLSRTDS